MRVGEVVVVASLASAVGTWAGRAKAQEPPATAANGATEPAPAEESSNWFREAAPAPTASEPETAEAGDEPERNHGGVSPTPPASEPAAHPPATSNAPTPRALPVVVRRWYGWQIVVVDISSVLVTVAGGGADSDEVAGIGVAGYFLAAPIVHFAHGHVGKGFGSLGLRIALPVVGGAIGRALADCPDRSDLCGIGEVGVGVGVGILSAMVIDAAVVAREEVEKKPMVGVSWTPTVRLEKTGGGLGVSGHF